MCACTPPPNNTRAGASTAPLCNTHAAIACERWGAEERRSTRKTRANHHAPALSAQPRLSSPFPTQSLSALHRAPAPAPAARRRPAAPRASAADAPSPALPRRAAGAALAATLASVLAPRARAAFSGASAPPDDKILCDAACEADLAKLTATTLPSGVSFKDVIVGSGPAPRVGFQVVAHYVAMTPAGRVFDSSLNRGAPYDIRVGTGQIVAGLDEAIASMRVGGLRRVYVPGALAFPKGLPSGPGRPRVPPACDVVFDVQLLYIPGLDDE